MGNVESNVHNLARVINGKEFLKSETRKQRRDVLYGKSFQPFDDMASFYRLRNVEAPSHIGWGNAEGLAKLFQLALQGKIFPKHIWEELTSPCVNTFDLVLGETRNYTCGGLVDYVEQFATGRHVYGHSGVGGHFVFGDLDLGLSMSFTTNLMFMESISRQQDLVFACYEGIDIRKDINIKTAKL